MIPRTKRRLRLTRPKTARAVARRAGTLEEFGYNLRDWLHELRRLSTRQQLHDAVWVKPERLADRFEGGAIADAYLAAQVHALCNRAGIRAPRWVRDPCYVLEDPWFAVEGKLLRPYLLLDTPEEFRRRNLFTVPELTFQVRRGRPAVSDAQKREKARDRSALAMASRKNG